MELEQMTQNKEKTSTDRIEKRVTLKAPRSRVWKALTRHDEFGKWFGVNLENGFAEGTTVRGNITIKGYEHATLEMKIERLDPENLFSYRWHPYAVDTKTDYSSEPMTLVEFRLADAADGTLLTIVESGFDRIPAARRAEAFRMNDNGWTGQIKNIERYVSQP